ncbi:MAG: S24 family peptidase [Candidatus Cloacimonetes bacterium]|nr:S24 family peptidase [Candidatus Cloacimonadota bacterium]
MNKPTIGQRLSLVIKAMRLKDYQFATKYGISRASLSRYKLNERYPDPEFLEALSRDNINIHWLFTGNGSMYARDEFQELIQSNQSNIKQGSSAPSIISPVLQSINDQDFDPTQSISFPIVGEIAAGPPLEIRDEWSQMGQIQLPVSLLPGNPKQYTVFQVNGKSMEPVIQHQDIVVIKSNQNWEDADDKIAVVRTDDGLTIKKVQIDHNRQQIILHPFNIDYPVLVLDSDWNYGAFLIGTIALQLRFF